MRQPTLHTSRLMLRPFKMADAPAVQRLLAAREIAEMTANIPHPYEDGMAEEWILSHTSVAVLHYAFAELNLNRVFASHYTKNPASGRVMQKIGMRYEGLQRQHRLKWENFEDLALYGILRDDWLAMQSISDEI